MSCDLLVDLVAVLGPIRQCRLDLVHRQAEGVGNLGGTALSSLVLLPGLLASGIGMLIFLAGLSSPEARASFNSSPASRPMNASISTPPTFMAIP